MRMIILNFINKLKTVNAEDLAFFFFSMSAIFTVLGPSVHYSMWGLTLLTLIYSKVRNGSKLFLSVHCESKKTFVLLMLFAFWASVPNFFNAESTYIWAHGLSCYAEFVLGILFTMRILNTEEKLDKFIKWFVIVNSIMAMLYTLSISSHFLGIPESFKMPNGSMINSNTSGAYAFMIFPLLIWYAFNKIESHFIRILICITSLAITLISTSSGAWLSVGIEGIILLYFIIRFKKQKIKNLLLYLIIPFVVLAACSQITDNKAWTMVESELMKDRIFLQGETSLNNVTSGRYDIWRATLYMSKKHPAFGYGRKSYPYEYEKNLETFKQIIHDFDYTTIATHPHNMYLYTIFTGGIPAVLLLCSGYFLLICIALKGLNNKKQLFWSVIVLSILLGNAIYGTNGDILEGRRDIAVILYTIIGVTLIIPNLSSDKLSQ